MDGVVPTRKMAPFRFDLTILGEIVALEGTSHCANSTAYGARIDTKSHRPAAYVSLHFSASEGMHQFVENLEWLISHAAVLPGLNARAREQFNERAAEWRAATVKPPLPEDARQHKVLAENAVQEKHFAKAIDQYEAALDTFPTWPEGQFNAALLCGETGDYEDAMQHMQNYVQLVPDAQDAQAARDKILIWREKLSAEDKSVSPDVANLKKKAVRK